MVTLRKVFWFFAVIVLSVCINYWMKSLRAAFYQKSKLSDDRKNAFSSVDPKTHLVE